MARPVLQSKAHKTALPPTHRLSCAPSFLSTSTPTNFHPQFVMDWTDAHKEADRHDRAVVERAKRGITKRRSDLRKGKQEGATKEKEPDTKAAKPAQKRNVPKKRRDASKDKGTITPEAEEPQDEKTLIDNYDNATRIRRRSVADDSYKRAFEKKVETSPKGKLKQPLNAASFARMAHEAN